MWREDRDHPEPGKTSALPTRTRPLILLLATTHTQQKNPPQHPTTTTTTKKNTTDKILSKFGEGTFGRVLECWDRLERDYVAVKVRR